MSTDSAREERLQIMLSGDELALLDDFRFKMRMPSRAAAVRELLRRGLGAEGYAAALSGQKSTDFGVAPQMDGGTPVEGRDGRGNGKNTIRK
jgi:hypothetical protein